MKTILHVGLPKTGTTTLQQTFKRSFEYLAERSVLFPRNPRSFRFASHKIIAAHALPKTSYGSDLRALTRNGALTEEYFSLFRDGLRAQLSDHDPEVCVISAEHFSTTSLNTQKLCDFLFSFTTDLEVVLYVRKPSARALSLLQQNLKKNNNVRLRSGVGLAYYRFLVESFGAECVKVRCCDRSRLLGGDIVTDFTEAFLCRQGISRDRLTPPRNTNETLSFESIILVMLARSYLHSLPSDMVRARIKRLIKALRRTEAEIGKRPPRYCAGVADRIDYASPDALVLRDVSRIEFEGFDYGRLERGEFSEGLPKQVKLTDIVEIDLAYLKDLARTATRDDDIKGHSELTLPLGAALRIETPGDWES